MNYTISISDDKKYIILKNTGKITSENVKQRIIEAHQVGEKYNLHCYLMDLVEANNTDTIVNNYDFAYKDMKENKGINMFACVAFLVAENDHSHDFIETVLINAGYDIKLFRSKEKAIQYLLENS
ncbi:MAG: hypothetical protein JXR70_15560 [Spirochaetales bacterium]|nr:hypothetical protein [Spirochaetales bacterium]